jgi:hypothetical protein
MNLHSSLYFQVHRLIEIPIGRNYQQLVNKMYAKNPDEIIRELLTDILSHCHRNVLTSAGTLVHSS